MSQQNISIDNLPDLLTVREVAQILRVSPLTIKRWGKRGKLPAIRINSRGDRRYKKEAVLWLLGMTQKDFARNFGVSLDTVRNWEQGRRQPEGAARVLLAVIERNPVAVLEVVRNAA